MKPESIAEPERIDHNHGTTRLEPPEATWALHDGRAGNAAGIRAYVRAGSAARDVHLQAGLLARWLAPALAGPVRIVRPRVPRRLRIAARTGHRLRRAALATRLLRERGSRVVHILLDPRSTRTRPC